jgi:hypothetical protein
LSKISGKISINSETNTSEENEEIAKVSDINRVDDTTNIRKAMDNPALVEKTSGSSCTVS